MGRLNFEMQTLETTAAQEKQRKEALKFATPEQLKGRFSYSLIVIKFL